ncbi:DUF4149 domain-containing protein [Tautonia sociabilis]|uniref:TMEM205-like domain-containing protein n=1 Tax=Tautonia sociabilis TaxID=2080755 RepID=A0A432MF34_9BACT|nr:DUF4149 domain-containing protein [Tautonia sociabilis]RUL84363.1 hypothetical protein TsocGM_20335 [Tautonia sociabilis]
MPLRSLALRVFCLLGLSVWMGGFTFYSAVVIPVLHESLGSLDTGFVTQEVTDYLNYIGVGVVLVWWAAAWVERGEGPARVRAVRLLFLAATTLILLGLIALHRVMDGRLETGSLRGFYPLHRAYLIASTVQWIVNLALMTALLVPSRLPEKGS